MLVALTATSVVQVRCEERYSELERERVKLLTDNDANTNKIEETETGNDKSEDTGKDTDKDVLDDNTNGDKDIPDEIGDTNKCETGVEVRCDSLDMIQIMSDPNFNPLLSKDIRTNLSRLRFLGSGTLMLYLSALFLTYNLL